MRIHRTTVLIAIATALSTATAIQWSTRAWPFRLSGPEPVRVTISPETTRILAPLDSAGYSDYVAALNQRFSTGVTPENNVEVALRKVLNRTKALAPDLKAYHEILGVEPLPTVVGPRFTSFYSFVDNEPAPLKEQYHRDDWDMNRPWVAHDRPKHVAWLAQHEAVLKEVALALERPLWFVPVVDCSFWDSPAGGARLGKYPVRVPVGFGTFEETTDVREIAQLLLCRVRLRLGEGNASASVDDFNLLLRLSERVLDRPSAWNKLIGSALHTMTFSALDDVLASPRLTPEQTDRLAQMWDRWSPPSSWSDSTDIWGRWYSLAVVVQLARYGATAALDPGLTFGTGEKYDALRRRLAWFASWHRVDWDAALIETNRLFDELVRVSRIPSQKTRDEEFKTLGRMIADQAAEKDSFWSRNFGSNLPAREHQARKLAAFLLLDLPKQVESQANCRVRLESRWRVGRLAIDVVRFRQRHGRYPANFAEIVQEFGPRNTRDPHRESVDLIYRANPCGFVVYSVGENGLDNNGWPRGEWDPITKTDGDDTAVRVGYP